MKPAKLTFFAIAVSAVAPFAGPARAELTTHPFDQAPITQVQPADAAEPAETPATDAAPAPVAPTEPTPSPNPPAFSFTDQFGKQKYSTCSMTYHLSGFSLGYKQYDGLGEVTCRNGQKAQVVLSSKSIGFTIGKSDIEGEGHFTDVKDIKEIYGNYISLGNHFGFINSIDRQILTRGEISLALIGKGRGFDIGVTIGDLTIRWR
ncbi:MULTISPECIES: hypothetical protein [Methylomonas]|uniref:Uncharacterized protein n=1 Tax=Methylomonas koyamae TaxID=702114 RepID=A0A177NFX2_9GAMM|nr:hypothetical protein [Methylomonas koyamae]OAI16761.1 hypothetical protein A1355_09635 [Methylomonas koyamae]